MTWDWLDAARYADTNGYQGDNERTMWPWRDWVVKAFNSNLPFDEFTKWQLAGDLLPDSTDQQVIATGFCRNHMINGEGGRIAEENRVEYVMDMSETMGTVWLGLTLNCCRCHDHKYDPITNADYYRLFAYFNQTPVVGNGGNAQTAPVLETPSVEQSTEIDQLSRQIAGLDSEMAAVAKRTARGLNQWVEKKREAIAEETQWHQASLTSFFASGAKLRKLSDGSILASAKNPDNDTYIVTGSTDIQEITGMRLEALQHSSLTGDGLSRSESGNFVLTSLEVSIVEGNEKDSVEIDSSSATFEQPNHPVSAAYDGDKSTGWAVYKNGKVSAPQTAVFRFASPIKLSPTAKIEFVLKHESKHRKHNIGCFRISLTDDAKPRLSNVADELYVALRTDETKRSEKHVRVLGQAYRNELPEYKSLKRERDVVTKKLQKLRAVVPKVMVMADQEKRRETFILERGLYNKPGEKVDAAVPRFLSTHGDNADPAEDHDANRARLAEWIVSDDNPLTARVTVNRIWQQFFGIGLVKTTEDFGAQGEIPIQMDLLNWLAAEFRDSGWNLKHLIKLIVSSHTYRQSSRLRSRSEYEYDPANRYLSRGARYRMPSWMIRDQALAASGLLSMRLGGAPVNTYQPPDVWEDASFGKKKYVRDEGEKLYRRSLYIFWRRIVAPTMLFDSASRQTCTVKISRTNTPLHALQTLNDVTYVEAARNLAQRVLLDESVKDERSRIDRIMNHVLARDASDEEAKVFAAGLARTSDQFGDQPNDAAKLLSVGESSPNGRIDPVKHASWTALCLAILNMDETLNRE